MSDRSSGGQHAKKLAAHQWQPGDVKIPRKTGRIYKPIRFRRIGISPMKNNNRNPNLATNIFAIIHGLPLLVSITVIPILAGLFYWEAYQDDKTHQNDRAANSDLFLLVICSLMVVCWITFLIWILRRFLEKKRRGLHADGFVACKICGHNKCPPGENCPKCGRTLSPMSAKKSV